VWIILFLGGQLALLAQNEEADQTLLIGKIVSNINAKAVPFAFVANSQTGFGKETNDDGIFKLNTHVNDTLFFRCLGYRDTLIVVNEQMLSDTLVWAVNKKTYEIESVDVLMFKSYASFRHMVANMDMMPDNSMKMNFGFTMTDLRRAEKEKSGTAGFTGRFGGGGATREEKKYAVFLRNEKRYERFREMTSRENMKYLTSLEGAQLDSFMVFLRTKHKINPDLSDYDMMSAINQVFEEFLALNTDSLRQKN
jgi:hypothetical protein